MKRNILFSCTLLIFVGQLFAQQGFYLKPIIELKWHRQRYPIDYSIQVPPTNQIPFAENFQIISQNNYRIPGFTIGLMAGYNFKRWSIESGICQDQTSSGINFRCLAVNQRDSSLNTTMFYSNDGITMTKVPVRFYYNIFKKDSLSHDKRNFSICASLFAGIDIFLKPAGDPSIPLTGSGIDPYVGKGQYIHVTESLYDSRETWAYAKAIGITFRWYKRNVNLLTLTLYANWAPFYMSRIELEILMPDGTRYLHTEFADGSGLYFNISKELSFRNFRKRYLHGGSN
jgi:hypothetical protein